MSKPLLTLPCKYTLSDFEQRGGKHHCQVCDHSLKDFRNSTNEEIRQAIAEAGKKTCGIFHPSQLAAKSSSFSTGFQRQMGLSLLGILGFIGPALLSSCEEAPATAPDPTKEEQAFSKLKFPMYLRGKLIDKQTHEPVKNASIRILQQDKTLLKGKTDNDGNFSIRIGQNDLSGPHFDLILNHYGYRNDTLHAMDASGLQKMGHLRLTLEASNDSGEICTPGKVAIAPTTNGDVSAPAMPQIEGEVMLPPEEPISGEPAVE